MTHCSKTILSRKLTYDQESAEHVELKRYCKVITHELTNVIRWAGAKNLYEMLDCFQINISN